MTFIMNYQQKVLHPFFSKFLTPFRESEIFPPSWREATIVAIPRPGRDPSDANNCRPIALISCLCKTMERRVSSLLMRTLESKGSLAAEQCGFMKNRSTADHFVRFDSYIREAIAKTIKQQK